MVIKKPVQKVLGRRLFKWTFPTKVRNLENTRMNLKIT